MLKSNLLSVATLILLLTCLTSCEKDEIPVERPENNYSNEPGELQRDEVAMESDYRNQLFYDLETASVVSENLKIEWDLGFECTAEGWRVITNTAKAMKCAHTEHTEFNQDIDITNLEWVWDAPSGSLDNTAIGNWTLEPNKIMVIDRGYDWEAAAQGYAEFRIISSSETEFTVEFSSLLSDEVNEFTILKDPSKNFQCFSFSDSFLSLDYVGTIADIQPDKTEWDLMFTQYLASLDTGDEVVAYLVVGVLTNHETSFAQQVYDIDFQEIDLEFASELEFDSNIDNIGYDWKYFDFEDGFLTYSDKYYVIKDAQGVFFKLRFLDFYNLDGEKGHPNFELQRL